MTKKIDDLSKREFKKLIGIRIHGIANKMDSGQKLTKSEKSFINTMATNINLDVQYQIRQKELRESSVKSKKQKSLKSIKSVINPRNTLFYWCSKCKREHKKYRKKDGKKVIIFQKHLEFGEIKSKEFILRQQMKKNWKIAKREQERYGAVGIPKRDKKKINLYSR